MAAVGGFAPGMAPGMLPGGGFAPAMGAGGNYEFTEPENIIIRGAGGRSRTWGVMSIIIGAIEVVLGGIVTAYGFTVSNATVKGTLIGLGLFVVIAALVPVITGKFYMDAGGALTDVANTQGDDIPLMLNAVSKLKIAVQIEALFTIGAFVLGLIVGILAASGVFS